LVLAAFSESGMAGLLDEARGRRGPVKLRPEIVSFVRESAAGPGELVEQVEHRYGCGCTGAPSSGPATVSAVVLAAE